MKRRQCWRGQALQPAVGTTGLGDNVDPNYRVSSAPPTAPRPFTQKQLFDLTPLEQTLQEHLSLWWSGVEVILYCDLKS